MSLLQGVGDKEQPEPLLDISLHLSSAGLAKRFILMRFLLVGLSGLCITSRAKAQGLDFLNPGGWTTSD